MGSTPRTSTLNVASETMLLFRKAVLARHGMLYGKLAEEATRALEKHAAQMLREAQ